MNTWRMGMIPILIGWIAILEVTPCQSSEVTLLNLPEVQAKAMAGDSEAGSSLGKWFCGDSNSQLDYVQAEHWFRKAAEKGSAAGQFGLGSLYLYGRGVKQDYKIAMQWFLKAAEQNDPIAQCSLGRMYFDGLGVARNYPEAYKWFDVSAKQDSLLAIRCRKITENLMTPEEKVTAHQLADQFRVTAKEFKVVLNSTQ